MSIGKKKFFPTSNLFVVRALATSQMDRPVQIPVSVGAFRSTSLHLSIGALPGTFPLTSDQSRYPLEVARRFAALALRCERGTLSAGCPLFALADRTWAAASCWLVAPADRNGHPATNLRDHRTLRRPGGPARVCHVRYWSSLAYTGGAMSQY